MKKFNSKFYMSLLLLLLLQGCMPDSLTKYKKDEVKKVASTNSTTTTTTTTDPTAAPDLTTLETFQLKNITQKDTTYHLHKYGKGNTSASCEIDVNDLGDGESTLVDQTNDILCWLEAEEVQLFFNGADLQVNAPAGQCEYIQVKPYFYWNAPPMNTQKELQAVTCGNTDDAACISAGGPNTLEPEDLTCYGDYSSIGGPNCDEGYVQINTINISATIPANASSTPPTNAIPSIITRTITKTPCGGKRSNCYGGPGVDFKVNKKGIPIPVDYLAYTGQSINYSITAPGPLGKGTGTNHYISNFTQLFKGTVDPDTYYYNYDYTTIGSSTGFEAFANTSSTSTSTYLSEGVSNFDSYSGVASGDSVIKDIANDPLKRADSTLIKIGTSTWTTALVAYYPVQAFYEFSCLNFASEVKGRIRLQIRDWNKKFRTPVASYTEVSESNAASLIKHSSNSTDYEDSGVGYWNDIIGWDFPFNYGSVVGAIPASSAVGDTGFLFPYSGFNDPAN